MKLINFSQIQGGKQLVEKVNKLSESNESFKVYSETLVVDKAQQTEFNLLLSSFKQEDLSIKFPIKLVINGISYYEPDFEINYDEKKIIWNRVSDNEGFDIDIDDKVILEIPLKELDNNTEETV